MVRTLAVSSSHQSPTERTHRTGLRAGLLGLVLAGCAATLPTEHVGEGNRRFQPVELHEVPFFPQEDYQCGPAALAAVLTWSGVSVTPEELRPQVYVPVRKGSLQVELAAAVRRHGRIAYVLEPSLDHLLAEVADGRPVIVLQNLGFGWHPVWHYAVVVGFNPGAEQIILRSGQLKRNLLSMRLFERTWRRGDYWALAVLRPGELPVTADVQRYLASVIALEKLGRWEAANEAYRAAVRRWPDNLVALMGLGNSAYARGDREGALAAFRRAVASHPHSAAAYNNLAHVLAEKGELERALRHARRAVELAGQGYPEFEAMLADIEARRE